MRAKLHLLLTLERDFKRVLPRHLKKPAQSRVRTHQSSRAGPPKRLGDEAQDCSGLARLLGQLDLCLVRGFSLDVPPNSAMKA